MGTEGPFWLVCLNAKLTRTTYWSVILQNVIQLLPGDISMCQYSKELRNEAMGTGIAVFRVVYESLKDVWSTNISYNTPTMVSRDRPTTFWRANSFCCGSRSKYPKHIIYVSHNRIIRWKHNHTHTHTSSSNICMDQFNWASMSAESFIILMKSFLSNAKFAQF